MKRALALATVVGLIATPVLAADLPRRTAPVAPAVSPLPIFSWTGFYVGANAGYGFGQFTGGTGNLFKDLNGFTGGLQAGYNRQTGQFVVGLETDINYAHLRVNNASLGIPGSKNTVDYYGTLRGRYGYAIDRFLPYVTAGLAYGGTTVKATGLGKSDPVHIGWAAGAGIEYALTNSITARIEGLYVDLADKRVLGGPGKSGAEFGVIRAGINAKF